MTNTASTKVCIRSLRGDVSHDGDDGEVMVVARGMVAIAILCDGVTEFMRIGW